MSDTNNVVMVSGRVSRPPRSVRDPKRKRGHVQVFPLAVREGDDEIVFPIVVARTLPDFVTFKPKAPLHEQPLITVVGRLRTRNVTKDLAKEVTALARRAGVADDVIAALEQSIAAQGNGEDEGTLEARRVVTEIVATSISLGGAW